MKLECLSPDGETEFADRNEESLVFRLTFDRFSLLLTGDMEESGEEKLLDSGILTPVTVLKAGHHGSATSSGERFIETLSRRSQCSPMEERTATAIRHRK